MFTFSIVKCAAHPALTIHFKSHSHHQCILFSYTHKHTLCTLQYPSSAIRKLNTNEQ